jgi:hypothetical protein
MKLKNITANRKNIPTNSGVILHNMRGMSMGLIASSVVLPVISAEAATGLMAVVISGYYGYKMEKETHDLKQLKKGSLTRFLTNS